MFHLAKRCKILTFSGAKRRRHRLGRGFLSGGYKKTKKKEKPKREQWIKSRGTCPALVRT